MWLKHTRKTQISLFNCLWITLTFLKNRLLLVIQHKSLMVADGLTFQLQMSACRVAVAFYSFAVPPPDYWWSRSLDWLLSSNKLLPFVKCSSSSCSYPAGGHGWYSSHHTSPWEKHMRRYTPWPKTSAANMGQFYPQPPTKKKKKIPHMTTKWKTQMAWINQAVCYFPALVSTC